MSAPRPRPAPDPLLDDLDRSQREAVTSPAAPLAILAGAGSGKTRVLTRRIAWLAREGRIDPGHVLAVTFTRRAAGELTNRLDGLGVRGRVTAGTFHALALSLLRRRAADRGEAPPVLLERKSRLLAPILRGRPDRAGPDHHAAPGGPEHAVALTREVTAEIEWAKARLVPPASYPHAAAGSHRNASMAPAAVGEVYARYEEEKRRRGLVDLDDLILRCARLLDTDDEFAAVTRWRFRHVFVDEFQDVTPAQLRLVRAWSAERDDLCVVGDAAQAIYSFAGAEPGALERFGELFPGASTVRLDTSYRSTPQIVAASRAVLGAARGAPMRTRVPDGSPPRVVSHPDDASEAEGVARELRRCRDRGFSWASMAVLYRTNAQATRFESTLAAAGIPVTVRAASPPSDADAPGAARGDGRTDRRSGGPGDAVSLLSFHGAKGLEFDVVHVTGVEDGLVPIAYASTHADVAEERRLLYVALSRAARELTVSWAKERTIGPMTRTRGPSPWLAEIEATVGPEVPPGTDPTLGIRRLRHAVRTARTPRSTRATRSGRGRDPVAPGAADPELYAALCRWRSARARAAGVPAHVIFPDAVLDAVTSHRPGSDAELLLVPGVGPIRAARHGAEILRVVAETRPRVGGR